MAKKKPTDAPLESTPSSMPDLADLALLITTTRQELLKVERRVQRLEALWTAQSGQTP